MLDERQITCPYCGDSFVTTIDASAGSQQYVEDCYVCCSPVVFHISVAADGVLTAVDVFREND